jgi:hypothetical protein
MDFSSKKAKPRRISSSGHRLEPNRGSISTESRPPLDIISRDEGGENIRENNHRDAERLCGDRKALPLRPVRASCTDQKCELARPLKRKQLFRAPIRDARPSDEIFTHTCPDCDKFSKLLKDNGASISSHNCILRHKSFCELSHTPPNIWAPWSQESRTG